jgi:hypothetical protein
MDHVIQVVGLSAPNLMAGLSNPKVIFFVLDLYARLLCWWALPMVGNFHLVVLLSIFHGRILNPFLECVATDRY